MSPFTFVRIAIAPALSLLPPQMDTPAARAMVLAICLQESELRHRTQLGEGPARGYAQFELSGVQHVLEHRASRAHALRVCAALDIIPAPSVVLAALEYSDVLTVCAARLRLWSIPDALPDIHGHDLGWAQYYAAWRPGKPRPHAWRGNFGVGWSVVTDGHELPTGTPRSSWGFSVPDATGRE